MTCSGPGGREGTFSFMMVWTIHTQEIPLLELYSAEKFVHLNSHSQITEGHCSLGEVKILFMLMQVGDLSLRFILIKQI